MKEFSTYKRYDISDYYEYFNNTNKNRFISLSGKKTRPGIVSFELYKKIIYQYLRIYFYYDFNQELNIKINLLYTH